MEQISRSIVLKWLADYFPGKGYGRLDNPNFSLFIGPKEQLQLC